MHIILLFCEYLLTVNMKYLTLKKQDKIKIHKQAKRLKENKLHCDQQYTFFWTSLKISFLLKPLYNISGK